MPRSRHCCILPALLVLSSCAGGPKPTSSDPGMASARGRADPQMMAVLAQLDALGPKPVQTLSPTEARLQPSASDAVVQLEQVKGMVAPDRMPPVGRVAETAMTGPAGEPVRLRVYTPTGDGPFPIVVYFHGGGWVIATLDTYDASCRALCSMAKAVVVSVDYRRAPEHKFPAAPEDCYAAVQYAAGRAAEFGGRPGQVAVAGESAGGNLAAVVCLMAEHRGGAMPVHQVLVYPITDDNFDTASYRANPDTKPLSGAAMRWFFQQYLTSPAEGANVLVCPLKATDDQLRGLPPATVVTDEIDPLHDDGQAYAAKLKAAGVDVAAQDYAGVTHEFFGMGGVVDGAKDAETFVADRLSRSFK